MQRSEIRRQRSEVRDPQKRAAEDRAYMKDCRSLLNYLNPLDLKPALRYI